MKTTKKLIPIKRNSVEITSAPQYISWELRHGECKVYDRDGKLTRVITPSECFKMKREFDRKYHFATGYNEEGAYLVEDVQC